MKRHSVGHANVYLCLLPSVYLLSISVSTCVEIHKLSVPSLVKYGTMGEVLLDCDFDHSEEEEKQLEVKWYHNDEHSPFFQVS